MANKLYDKCLVYDFEKLFKEKGYAYFKNGNYNLNIIGVRKNNNNKVTNLYDDCLVLIYNTPTGKNVRQVYNITTEPGTYYMTIKPMNKKGTAILVPGQYRATWQLGLHKGKYKALCQRKPVKVYRDGNMNMTYELNPKKVDEGIFGINIHRSNEAWTRTTVDQYSAGCQVFNNPRDFAAFIRFCEKQRELYGNNFTYTLINEEDMK